MDLQSHAAEVMRCCQELQTVVKGIVEEGDPDECCPRLLSDIHRHLFMQINILNGPAVSPADVISAARKQAGLVMPF